MNAFRRLMTAVLIAGTTAGLVLSALQFVAVVPLIHAAEAYEQSEPQAVQGHHDWQPAEGFERTAYTVLGTVLVGIAYSALLFGVASLLGIEVDRRSGLWLGLGGFACCTLSPALGLPPRPPGVPGAELHASQIWWAATAVVTAAGLWTIARARGSWPWRIAGTVVLLAPHLLGAPHATARSDVPFDLTRQFAVTAVATQAVFWLVLGGLWTRLYSNAVAAPS